MAQWLPCVIDGLGIGNFTLRGWSRDPLAYMGEDGADCWWTPPGMSCDAFIAAATSADGQLQPVDSAELPGAQASVRGHYTGASEKVRQFYTQEVADMVWNLYQDDFAAFGYERMVLQ